MRNKRSSGWEICNLEKSSKYLRKKPTSKNLVFSVRAFNCYQLWGMISLERFFTFYEKRDELENTVSLSFKPNLVANSALFMLRFCFCVTNYLFHYSPFVE